MKTAHALPLISILLAGSAFGAVAFTGCSSDSPADVPPANDTGTDSVVVDTGTVKDTQPDTKPGIDTAPGTCANDLPADFACADPKPVKGEKTCTEAAIQGLIANCFGTGGDCKKWQTANPECNKCTLTNWMVPLNGSFITTNTPACIKIVAPTSPCAKTEQCWFDCRLDVCCGGDAAGCSCDATPGSGTTEFDKCVAAARFAGSASKPKGACYDKAYKDAKVCEADATLANCFTLESFFRGACRDGGDWTNAASAGDAGVTDTGTDTTPPPDTTPADTADAD